MWHGGHEGLKAEGVKLAGSSDATDRTTACKGVVSLGSEIKSSHSVV